MKSPTAQRKVTPPQTQGASAQAQGLAQTVVNYLQLARSRLAEVDVEAPARQTGFMKRVPRQIPLRAFLLGLLALSVESVLSLERIAAGIAWAAQASYSKQALHKRLSPGLERFVAQTATAFFGQLAHAHAPNLLRSFQRVLLHDSTVETVPRRLAQAYPGARNQKPRARAALKIQFIADLLQSTVLQWTFSGFTRNDQAAAPDILALAQPDDLIIRDLGYFSLPVFEHLAARGAFFLSRYRHGVKVYNGQGQPLNLLRELRAQGRWEGWVRLGEAQLRVRLVALPAPEALANARRRQARANRDRRSPPTQTRLHLLRWTILITNVPASVWSAPDLAAVYRLRWRIEIVFKTWKSYWGLHRLNTRTGRLLGLSAAIKLLFCVLVYHQCQALELLGEGPRHVSLLRLARIFEQCACLFTAAVLNLSPQGLLERHLAQHLYYEQRPDRKNFYERLADLNRGLG